MSEKLSQTNEKIASAFLTLGQAFGILPQDEPQNDIEATREYREDEPQADMAQANYHSVVNETGGHVTGNASFTESSGYIYTEQLQPPIQTNNTRPISIRKLNNGYIVDVGCHSFAFETVDSLITKLSLYLKNPDVTERKFFKGELF